MRSRLVAVMVFSALAIAAASCDSGSGPDDGDTGPAPTTFGTSGCGQCVEERCSAEVDACASDPGCASYLECLYGCPMDPRGNADEACAEACPTGSTSTADELRQDLTYCRFDGAAANCTACGVPSILGQSCLPSSETNACWKCEDERCCDTFGACQADADCKAIAPCVQACAVDDYVCERQCYADYAAGMPLFGPRMICVMAECPVECGPVDPCTECVAAECSNSMAACYGDADCMSLESCVGQCAGSATCIDDCRASYVGGLELFDQYALCAVYNCAAACQ